MAGGGAGSSKGIELQGNRWQQGEVIVRREVLNDGRSWLEVPVIVVRDDSELLITYIPEGAPFRFPLGDFPTMMVATRGPRLGAGKDMAS